MEAAPRYMLLTLLTLFTLSTWFTLLTWFTVQTALHCFNSSMYAYIYIIGKVLP